MAEKIWCQISFLLFASLKVRIIKYSYANDCIG
jgi:hypothetical protein